MGHVKALGAEAAHGLVKGDGEGRDGAGALDLALVCHLGGADGTPGLLRIVHKPMDATVAASGWGGAVFTAL